MNLNKLIYLIGFFILNCMKNIKEIVSHGGITKPKPTFKGYGGSPIGNFPASQEFPTWVKDFSYPLDKRFKEYFNETSKYKNLREMTDTVGTKCGRSFENGTAQPIPKNGLVESNGVGHPGPCEFWIDDKKILFLPDCAKGMNGGKINIDFSSCKSGICLFYWVWFGTHIRHSWEVYKNCINIISENGGTSAPKPVEDNVNNPAVTSTPTIKPTLAPTVIPITTSTVKPPSKSTIIPTITPTTNPYSTIVPIPNTIKPSTSIPNTFVPSTEMPYTKPPTNENAPPKGTSSCKRKQK
jgi:hypothetical protein